MLYPAWDKDDLGTVEIYPAWNTGKLVPSLSLSVVGMPGFVYKLYMTYMAPSEGRYGVSSYNLRCRVISWYGQPGESVNTLYTISRPIMILSALTDFLATNPIVPMSF